MGIGVKVGEGSGVSESAGVCASRPEEIGGRDPHEVDVVKRRIIMKKIEKEYLFMIPPNTIIILYK